MLEKLVEDAPLTAVPAYCFVPFSFAHSRACATLSTSKLLLGIDNVDKRI
jgi:hypothetical protein